MQPGGKICNLCKWRHLVAKFETNASGRKFATNASGAIWWSNLQIIQVVPSFGQIYKFCNWCHLVVKFSTNANGTIWWPNLQLMQMAPSGCQICNECTWRHVVAKVCPSHRVNIWVRCASGNVFVNDMKDTWCKFHSGPTSPSRCFTNEKKYTKYLIFFKEKYLAHNLGHFAPSQKGLIKIGSQIASQ